MKYLVLVFCLCCLIGCSGVLYETNSKEYDFRKSNWGDLKAKVKFNEQGIHPQDLGNVLVYKSSLSNIPVKIVYIFDSKNRLRSAGYISDKPIGGVEYLKDYALEIHGEPTNHSNSEGMGWATDRSMIYLQMNERVVALTRYLSGDGPLSHLINTQPTVLYWDGVWGYMDITFLDELNNASQLTHYEKLLFGVIRSRKEFIWGNKRIPERPEIYNE